MRLSIKVTLFCTLTLLAVVVWATTFSSRLPFGKSVLIQNDKLTIDTRFLVALAKNPGREEWFKNYWELIYLIYLGHPESISVGIDVLASLPRVNPKYDHDGVKNLARAVSHRDIFWEILSKKPMAIRKKIVSYFDENPWNYDGKEDPNTMKLIILKSK